MLHDILTLRIDQEPFLASIYTLAALGALYLILRRPTVRWIVTVVVTIAAGLGLGYFACWLLGDQLDIFGVDFTQVTRMWVALAFTGVALAIVNLWRSRWWRRAIALVCIPLFVLTGAVGINVDFGMYRNLSDVLGVNPYGSGSLAHETGGASESATVVRTWRAPADQPKTGKVIAVKIPGTVSHFPARIADVYLPPAALVANPPVLPVIIMMSGQPGNPANIFTAGHIDGLLDAYASAHHGLAPIIVAPDQLGKPSNNPMCVNSPLGNSATYITVDVVNWIRAHLQVSGTGAGWGVGGFSQGATCAVQFAAGYPKLFSTAIAVSSELKPTIGAQTVAAAFGGSEAAYTAATPLGLFAKNAPFRHSMILFGVGQNDPKYTAFAHILVPAAQAAGIQSTLTTSPGSAHDWNTVHYVLKTDLPAAIAHLEQRQ